MNLTNIDGVKSVSRLDDGTVAVFTNKHGDDGIVPESAEFESLGYEVVGLKTMAYQQAVYLEVTGDGE